MYIYDRGNPNDQIASGQLRFDDGSTVAFDAVNNDGPRPVLRPIEPQQLNFFGTVR